MATFHNRCGKRVTLLNNNCTAVRNDCEFNHGIVLSAEPLVNDSLFEVKIDKKINSWSGNIEIGVTACDPETIELPACGILLRNGSWIMSGNSILKDGLSLVECYGEDLDKLSEHDRIGVMRTTDDELVIYINGVSQGVAAECIPSTVYAVVDMYGKCTQVSICNQLEHNNDDYLSCAGSAATIDTISLTSNLSELSLDLRQDWNVSLNLPPDNTIVPTTAVTANPPARDRLRFHQRCGSLIKLTSNSRTAERRRPFDEFNNGVVMTHRPLYDDELFEIRIDRLVEKWSGSIEVGVTTHNPTALEFPATMTNMRTGTIMMSGCGILSNGKGSRREYGEFNLDELREGDRVGMMRKSNGNLHYFINGLDQGVAASKVAQQVWGVIDLYGMTMKVTIVDRDEREEQNLITRRNTSLQEQLAYITDSQIADTDCYDRLLFHSNCGTHADVINNGRTAHRPNATDDFNNGVVLTSRPLKANELFEVRLDKIVSKWAGSIEIGVTTHSPTEFEFPFTMTNVRSGTWMMTGNGVMHNGTTIVDQYGINLDRLQIGDRVGVMRKENGTLHFYVNGVDQGPTARNLPERVYGVIDLYGQAAQVTIQYEGLDCYSPETVNSSISNTTLYSDLRFHHVHGKNARIINNGLTASRPRAYAEFNDAIIFSNRPLRDEEMFEIVIDNMVDRWSGGIELGVTAMRPEELDLPSTATDLDHDTWMLSGSAVMENGVNLKNGYKCDLDSLTADRRVGLMRHSDSMLHFYVDGVDQGPACQVARGPLYAVVDLYGQCAQVSLASAPRAPTSPHSERTPSLQASVVQPSPAQQPQPPDSYLAHRFSEWHGKNITLSENDTIATRIKDSSHCVVFSSTQLATDELFEVCLMATALQYAGSLKIGVTTLNVADPQFYTNVPNSIASIPADCWYITGNEIKTKTRLLSNTFSPSLEWLRVGDRIGLKRAHDSTLRAVINSQDIGVVAHNVPESVYAVVELCGRATGVEVTSSKPAPPMTTTLSMSVSQLTSLKLHDSLELVLDPPSHQYIKQDVTDATDIDSPTEMDRYEFYENHGRNIEILTNKITAKRVASYNQGIVIVSRPLIKGQILEIKIDQVNEKWTSSLILGVVCVPPGRVTFPVTALGFKKHCWIISSDWLSINGTKMKSNYGQCLENLGIGSRVGLLLSEAGRLSLVIDGLSLGPLPAALPLTAIYHAVFDLYGQCEQITLLNNQCDNMDSEDHLLSSVITSSQQMSEPSTSTSKEKSENHQCEKADLESREKESNIGIADSNLSEAMNGNGLMMNDSVASANALNEQLINAAAPSMANSLHASVMHSGGFRRCEYLRECMQFKKSLVLPDEFFAPEDPICYCNNCYQPCADELYLRKGDPAEEYSVPLGWAKFVLKCSMTNAMIEKWHVAFYGAKVNVIRSILDRGQPLNKEQLQWSNLISQPVVTGESTSSQIEFSPNLQYAASNVKYSYVDNRTKNKIVVSTAFQLLVRPGSYSVTQVSSVPAEDSDKIRPVCEWCTKETGAIVLNSLLIKLECF